MCIKEELEKLNERINIKFPGRNKLGRFNRASRKEICDLLAEQYPECFKKNIVNIPDFVEFHYGTSDSDGKRRRSEEDMYQVATRLTEILSDEKISKRSYGRMGKILLSGVSKQTLNNTHRVKDTGDESYRHKLLDFSRQTNDHVYISTDVGIVIFNVVAGDANAADENSKLDAKAVEAILNFGLNENENNLISVSHVTIEISGASGGKDKSFNHITTTEGDWKPLDVSLSPIEQGALWQKLKKLFNVLRSNRKQAGKVLSKRDKVASVEQLIYFVGKCLVLLNMQCACGLLDGLKPGKHWKRYQAEEGPTDLFICWSRRQKKLADEIAHHFNKVETTGPLRVITRGCFGSGKTLVMLYAIREFLKLHNGAKVLVLIDEQYKQLRERITKTFEESKVVVRSSDEYSEAVTSANYGLVTCDENSHKDYMKEIMELKDPNIHVLIFSPSSPPSFNTTFGYRLRDLGTTNYRSHKRIVDLCMCLNAARSLSGFFVKSELGAHAQCQHNIPCAYFINTKNKTWVTNSGNSWGDSSDDKDEFATASAYYVSNFISKTCYESNTLVCCYCHPVVMDTIKNLTRKEVSGQRYRRLRFADVNEIRGMEFENVICVVDCSSDNLNVTLLEVGITRCISRLALLINPLTDIQPCSPSFEETYRANVATERQDEITRGVRNFRRKSPTSPETDILSYPYPIIRSQFNEGYASDASDYTGVTIE